jgi:5-methylcytosine-specific restriction endonuclease McrA
MDFNSIHFNNRLFAGKPPKKSQIDIPVFPIYTNTRARDLVITCIHVADVNNCHAYYRIKPDVCQRLTGSTRKSKLIKIDQILDASVDASAHFIFHSDVPQFIHAVNNSFRGVQFVLAEVRRTSSLPTEPIDLTLDTLREMETHAANVAAAGPSTTLPPVWKVMTNATADPSSDDDKMAEPDSCTASPVHTSPRRTASVDYKEGADDPSDSDDQDQDLTTTAPPPKRTRVNRRAARRAPPGDVPTTCETSSSDSDNLPTEAPAPKRARVKSAPPRGASGVPNDAATQRENALVKRESALALREEALAKREEALTHREQALARREAALGRTQPAPVAPKPSVAAPVPVASPEAEVPAVAPTTQPSGRLGRRHQRGPEGAYCPPRPPVDDELRSEVFQKQVSRPHRHKGASCVGCGERVDEGSAVLASGLGRVWVGCAGCWEEDRPSGVTRERVLFRRKDLWLEAGLPLEKTCCFLCTAELDYFSAQVGHDVAHSLGGSLHLSNLEPVCGPCNLFMGDARFDEAKRVHARALRLRTEVDSAVAGVCGCGGRHQLRAVPGKIGGNLELRCAGEVVGLLDAQCSGVQWVDRRPTMSVVGTHKQLIFLRKVVSRARVVRSDILGVV